MAKQRQSITALLMTLPLAFALGISAQTLVNVERIAFGTFPNLRLTKRSKLSVKDSTRLAICLLLMTSRLPIME